MGGLVYYGDKKIFHKRINNQFILDNWTRGRLSGQFPQCVTLEISQFYALDNITKFYDTYIQIFEIVR